MSAVWLSRVFWEEWRDLAAPQCYQWEEGLAWPAACTLRLCLYWSEDPWCKDMCTVPRTTPTCRGVHPTTGGRTTVLNWQHQQWLTLDKQSQPLDTKCYCYWCKLVVGGCWSFASERLGLLTSQMVCHKLVTVLLTFLHLDTDSALDIIASDIASARILVNFYLVFCYNKTCDLLLLVESCLTHQISHTLPCPVAIIIE